MAQAVRLIDRARLEEIVREAGRIALSRWPGHGHALETWEKLPGNPVSQADLVIVPTQGSQLDAEQASRALKVIKQQEKMSGRPVP